MLGPFQILKPALTLRPPAAAQGEAKDPGPVVWWKLDEGGGRTVASAAGTNFIGRIHGQPRWGPDQGRQGGALEFDGLNTWIECPDGADLNLGDRMSVTAWYKAGAKGQGGDTLVAKGTAWQLLHRRTDKPEVAFVLQGPEPTGKAKGQPPQAVCPAPPADDQWHHLAGVYDGTRIVLYVDGAESASTPAAGSLVWNNLPISLGDNAASRGQRWSGWLDDVRVYRRALGGPEVKALQVEGAR